MAFFPLAGEIAATKAAVEDVSEKINSYRKEMAETYRLLNAEAQKEVNHNAKQFQFLF